MFDNPYEYPPRKAGPHVNPRATAGIGVVLLALALALAAAGAQAFPRAEAQIVTSPAQLRQVEIIAGPTQTAFYLHSAGYRLRTNANSSPSSPAAAPGASPGPPPTPSASPSPTPGPTSPRATRKESPSLSPPRDETGSNCRAETQSAFRNFCVSFLLPDVILAVAGELCISRNAVASDAAHIANVSTILARWDRHFSVTRKAMETMRIGAVGGNQRWLKALRFSAIRLLGEVAAVVYGDSPSLSTVRNIGD